MADEPKGVLAQHDDRLASDPKYRESALTPPAEVRGKYLDDTAPLSTSAHAEHHGAGVQVISGHTERISDATNPALTEAVPTALSVDGGGLHISGSSSSTDDIAELKGDELDQAVKDAGIEGRSTMTADEKRDALRKARGS